MGTRLSQQMTIKKEKKMKNNNEKYDYDDYGSYIDSYFEDYPEGFNPDDPDDYDENEKVEKMRNNFENNSDVLFKTYDFLQRMTDYFNTDNNGLEYFNPDELHLTYYDYNEGINIIIYKLFDVLFNAYGKHCLCLYVYYNKKAHFRGMGAFEALKFRGLENLESITFETVRRPDNLDFFDEWDPYTATGCYTETETFHIENKDEPIVRVFDRYSPDDLGPCDPRA